MSIEAAIQANTEAVTKNTAAMLSLQAAILQALTGKAAVNTDTSGGTQQGNAGAGAAVPSNGAATGAATGEVKRGPGRPSKEELEKRKALETQQASGQQTVTPAAGAMTQQPAADTAGAGLASSAEDPDLAALLGSGEEVKPVEYNMPALQKMIKECSFFGQRYVKLALAEIRKFKTHNEMEVDQLPKLQVKDFNAFGAALQVIWAEGDKAAREAKDPALTI